MSPLSKWPCLIPREATLSERRAGCPPTGHAAGINPTARCTTHGDLANAGGKIAQWLQTVKVCQLRDHGQVAEPRRRAQLTHSPRLGYSSLNVGALCFLPHLSLLHLGEGRIGCFDGRSFPGLIEAETRQRQPERDGLATGRSSTHETRSQVPRGNPMAEAQARSDGPQDGGNSQPASPSPKEKVLTPEQLLLGSAVEPSDDSPTIISRARQAPMRMEDTLAGMLRGRRLAHFELLEPIGVGGMAAVIRARDTQLDRTVALKILPPEMAADTENVRRFHQEARAAAKLDHENIARVFFCGEDQGLHFIAFEFVEGENLRILLERRGRMPVPEAIHYLLQIATGLAHAAARGVVHRDIKPSNIIISPNGRAKLVDMGLARSLEPQCDGGLTQSGVTLGTFDYISPEQALEPREADARSDIYSLGCTLYHMLSGQPPVPEGTAARKLHHHQNVDPVDPRQLNPAIPDEVAALLARMMAKSPKERYQRPEELVSHLIMLAQRLGGPSQGADSVLFVDAPLPGQPRTRPALVVVSAVLALVALIAVLGPWPASSTKPSPEPSLPKGAQGLRDNVTSAARNGTPAPVDSTADPRVPVTHQEVATLHTRDAKELANFLQKRDPVAKVYLTGDLHIGRDNQLLFQGRDLTIEPDKSLQDPPTISLRADPTTGEESCTALTVMSGTAVIRRVRFELEPGAGANMHMVAVAQHGGRLTLENCAFFQADGRGPGQGRMSSVTVSGPVTGEDKPTLNLHACYFARGQSAVTLTRPAEVEVRHCAFGPHTATLFDLQNERNGLASSAAGLQLQNCSAFVVGDSVFRLDEGLCCRLRVENCVLSCPENEAAAHGLAVLIQQVGSKPIKLSYTSLHNGHHNLKALWMRSSRQGPQEAIQDWTAFQQRFDVEGEKPIEWTSSPWENPKPFQALRNERPELAFRLNTTLPELRQAEHPTQLIGVEHGVWGRSYKEKLTPLEETRPSESVARREERIVDPSLAAPKENTYRTLRQALEDTKPGEVILIKHQGVLAVEPVRLEKAGVDVSIKPHAGYHPILSIGQTTEQDAAMFRIYDGQLKLEALEFQLAPGSSPFKAQTVVAVMGDGQCTLKDCLVTLDGSKEVPLALVTLADPAGVMKMEPQATPQQDPKVSIESCFARGTGNLVAVRASRPFELRVERSLAALDGSLLLIDGTAKETPPRARAQVTLEQVTTYLTDHLVWLRASPEEGRTMKGLVPTQFKLATNCLFVSAGGKSLVHLEGVDTEDQMKRLFSWGESRHNLYSNFTPSILDQQPSGGNDALMPPLPYGKTQWEGFTQEQDARFERLRFSALPAPDAPLSKVLAAEFKTKPEANVQGYGADLEALPKPQEIPAAGNLAPEN
jgi:serine/threonine protein kinase